MTADLGLPLQTPRLRLRPLESGDAAAMFAYRALPEVTRFQCWAPADEAEIGRFIAEQRRLRPDTPGTWYQLAICRRDDGLLIGDCGLHFQLEADWQAEVGITVAPAYQRSGYAAEALAAVIGFLFGGLGKHRVFASVDPRNQASIGLLERLGLRREAWFRQSLPFKGGWADDVVYAVLADEWRGRDASGTGASRRAAPAAQNE